jgi:hypothetical protein
VRWVRFYLHTLSCPTWWQVDLGSKKSIDQIIIYNRIDYCANRLSNYQVSISNKKIMIKKFTIAFKNNFVKVFYEIQKFYPLNDD